MNHPPFPNSDGIDIQALRASVEAQSGGPVAVVETHLSWVLLAPELAYKLKKPVHLPFVDARTAAAREKLCREELRLNRCMAAPLYLGVLPVRGTAAAPRLDGAGEPVDHVVVMRRFPPGALVSEMLQAGQLGAGDLAPFAQRLARFHAEAPAVASGSPRGSPAAVLAAVASVLDQLAPLCGDGPLAGLRAWLAAEGAALQSGLRRRQRDGHVRECHGDLHLDNLVRIDGEIMAFDCLEFDAGLRTVDTICDIAFATMDLAVRGRPDLARGFLDDYLQASGDYGGVAVLRFYEIYRALVRALAQALRRACGAPAGYEPPYLAWARAVAGEARAAPVLVLMHGLSGSGKSTVARQLVEQGGAVRLRSDVERKRLFLHDVGAPLAGAQAALYDAAASERTYGHLLALARQLLSAGCPVIVDAAFLQRAQRDAFRTLAAALHVPLRIVHCGAPEDILRARLRARAATGKDPSDADVHVLANQLAQQQPLERHEQACTVVVPSDAPVDAAALWTLVASPAPLSPIDADQGGAALPAASSRP